MTRFKELFFISIFLLSFSACDSTSSNCPQCNMPIPEAKEYTSTLDKSSFDDIGCIILHSKENHTNLKNAKVFTNDTKRYINIDKAYYSVNDKTPMNYGFGAYEEKDTNKIRFDVVQQKMLRGENLTNPKIRKQILGY